MKNVKITDEVIKKAKQKASSMGTLKNSITKGEGNLAGFVGEAIVAEALCIAENNTFDYDMKYKNFKIDVKTKRVNTPPRPFYECSIAALNTKQECDFYVFTRVLNTLKEGWILGYLPKQDYFNLATFYKKGDIDPSNGWEVRTDCYNVPISKLKNIQDFLTEDYK